MRERAVARQPRAIGEDADVLAQPALIVEHIAAHMRPFREHRAERVADRCAAAPAAARPAHAGAARW